MRTDHSLINRDNLLTSWARHLAKAARQGALTGRPCPVSRIETIAGALEIFAGLGSGHLLRALSKNDAAVLRQFIPWHFPGQPQVYMAGRYVRCEAGWPAHLASTTIRLDELCEKPERGGRWVAGMSESGAVVILSLSDRTLHLLISGATGSGKSVKLRSAVLQLSRDPDNSILLIDGKMGESTAGRAPGGGRRAVCGGWSDRAQRVGLGCRRDEAALPERKAGWTHHRRN